MIDFTKLRLALGHLEAMLVRLEAFKTQAEVDAVLREAVIEAAIHRFETAYDTIWKFIKRHLTEVLGMPDTPSSPKPILRIADQNDLLNGRIDEWLKYAEARVSTAHDYSAEKATATLSLVDPFLQDAIQVYETLSGTPWKQASPNA
jgi:nucleotidyltransferase substrate binding protein (TIGR01987 family)